MISDSIEYPFYLKDYASLQMWFNSQFDDLDSQSRGDRFAVFVQRLVRQTAIGKQFDEPQPDKKTHDGGVDLHAESIDGKSILLVQSKYTLRDKAEFNTIISKFRDYYQQKFGGKVGSLFAYGNVSTGSDVTVHFQIVTLQDLSRIKRLFEESELASVSYYEELVRTNRIDIIDGHQILQLLRAAYRRTNLVPSSLSIQFATPPIEWGNVFLGIVSSTELKSLYEEHGDALFFENLRDFLASTEVNNDITRTVLDAPDQLLARNNGIVFKASQVVLTSPQTLLLSEASLVNGCQTTMSIVSKSSKECFVSIKVVNASAEDAWEITKAANFQNQVKRFDLELAEFLRPQIVKKAANQAAYGYKGNSSPLSVLDAIYSGEIIYEELRSLFIGIFSTEPSNIFDLEYSALLPELMSRFYKREEDANLLFDDLFTLYEAAQKSLDAIKERIQKNSDTYQRFFKDNKTAYRAFITLLASCAASEIDMSKAKSIDERWVTINKFLRSIVSIIHDEPNKFDRYYRYTVQAVTASVKGRDSSEIKQYLWKYMRDTGFEVFLERVHNVAALASDLT